MQLVPLQRGFHRGGFEFDSGPSYFLGLSSPPGESINGLRQVLDAVVGLCTI
jgi:hypothetical protein